MCLAGATSQASSTARRTRAKLCSISELPVSVAEAESPSVTCRTSDVVRTTATPNEPTHELRLAYMNGATTHEVKFKCLLNQVAIAASAGDIVSAQVTFTVTGPLQTATLA